MLLRQQGFKSINSFYYIRIYTKSKELRKDLLGLY